MKYIVTRQSYWYATEDDPYGIEIALDDDETSNPGALSARYEHDFFTSNDPREIVDAAIRLRTAWRKDLPREKPLAFTFSFNDLCYPGLYEGDTIYDLRRWAEETYAEMLKCDFCGELIPDAQKAWQHIDDWGEDAPKFCSERCAEDAEIRWHKELPEEWCDVPDCIYHDHPEETE